MSSHEGFVVGLFWLASGANDVTVVDCSWMGCLGCAVWWVLGFGTTVTTPLNR